MQPPRQRRTKGPRPLSRIGRAAVVELGATLAALLLARIVILAGPGPERSEFTRWFTRATDLLVWPAAQVPGGGVHLLHALTLADLVTVAVLILLTALAVGTMAGWEAEGSPEPNPNGHLARVERRKRMLD